MSRDRGSRFIAAFNEIEDHFRRTLRRDVHAGFAEMARDYGQAKRLPRDHLEALIAFANLRNAIQHSRYYDGRPIAEPVEDVVTRIERLCDQLKTPPTIGSVMGKSAVATCAPADPLRPQLWEMLKRDYSQVPVYDKGRYVGLLTTNAVARWLAANFDSDGNLVHEEPCVAEVLAFTEPYERVELLSKRETVAVALDLLSAAAQGEAPMTALIISEGGKLSDKPLGMLNRFDVPALTRALQLR